MWVVHALGVCTLVALVRCRSVVPTAQGTSDWEGLSQLQGLKTRPALPLKKGVITTNQEDKAPRKTSPAKDDVSMQQTRMFVGSDNDEALEGLGELFATTEEYEDEAPEEKGELDLTESNNPDNLDGLCVVRTTLCMHA